MNTAQNTLNTLGYALNSNAVSKELLVQYIDNPDGSIRWIWPANSKRPLFLKFYYIQGVKARLFAWVIQLIFALKLQRLVFKRSKVITNDHLISSEHQWALFTGTVGPNQKYILYQNNATGKQGSFTKIPITPQSRMLINNEVNCLQCLENAGHLSFNLPSILNSDTDLVTFRENERFTKRNSKWTLWHSNMMHSLTKINLLETSYIDFDNRHQISCRIQALQNSGLKLPSGIVKKLDYLHQSLSGSSFLTHLAHGDFTPWNTLSNQSNLLYVYDWELSNSNYPLGFDFFHFIIQKGVLTQHKPWNEIRSEISYHQSDIFKDHCYEKYLALYLLVNVLKYLEIYNSQRSWHTQVHWLLKTWNMALSDVLKSRINQRELVILDCFDHLHSKKYSGLKLQYLPEKLPEYSDIDLLMSKNVSNDLVGMLKKHPLVTKLKVQKGMAMTKLFALMSSNQVLSIDTIHKLKRKNLEYMSVPELLEKPYIDKYGIKKVALMDLLQYLGLFYGLNHAKIPSQYDAYADLICTDNKELDFLINDQFYSDIPNTARLNIEVKKLVQNKGFSHVKNTLAYCFDVLLNILHQRGMVITFSGVDGVGKSTVIENIKKAVEKKFRKRVVVIRHRPSLLPILSAWTKGKARAEKEAAENLPRQGQNRNVLSSLLRFGYYYTDYLLGQLYVYCKHVLRGDVVLYDRYYFDFINDSLRSNIILPKWMLKSGYSFLLKPDLNFFLYADALTILSRKKELSESTINTLTQDYLSLFKKLGRSNTNQYQAIENICLDQTIGLISSHIQSKLM